MLSVYRGVAHPWLADVMGHMTTRHYVAMFDDASYHFLFEAFGWSGDSVEGSGLDLAKFFRLQDRAEGNFNIVFP